MAGGAKETATRTTAAAGAGAALAAEGEEHTGQSRHVGATPQDFAQSIRAPGPTFRGLSEPSGRPAASAPHRHRYRRLPAAGGPTPPRPECRPSPVRIWVVLGPPTRPGSAQGPPRKDSRQQPSVAALFGQERSISRLEAAASGGDLKKSTPQIAGSGGGQPQRAGTAAAKGSVDAPRP